MHTRSPPAQLRVTLGVQVFDPVVSLLQVIISKLNIGGCHVLDLLSPEDEEE